MEVLIKEGVTVLCKPDIDIYPPQVSFELASFDKSRFPTRTQIMEILGSPFNRSSNEDTLMYEYCLSSCQKKSSDKAQFKFSFSRDGKLQHSIAKYFGYMAKLELDRELPLAIIKLD